MGGNEEFLKLTKETIKTELIAERMVGNAVKRDQLDFVFNTLLYIYNSPAKENMIKKDPAVKEYTIPRLLILRYLDHVVKVKILMIDRLTWIFFNKISSFIFNFIN